jgi:RNA polymerase sigma-70 factor (ECF subfamily)
MVGGATAYGARGGGMDEREAIARLRRGDIGGLEVLVRRHQHAALRVAFLIGRDAALAEDIVQEAFLRAYARIDRFDAARPFGPWFLRVVANDTLNAVTRRRQAPLDPTLAGTLPDRALGPEALLLAAETEGEVRAALDRLAPAQRAALVARYYLDLDDATAAHHFRIPPGTLRRRLHDARARLRRLLPAPGGADGAE